ncbi:MAG: GNAT family N-acetyltransferase [Alcaligenes sp.]
MKSIQEAQALRLRTGTWDELGEQALQVRLAVFVQEQKVPLEEEVDAQDPLSVHVVAYDGERPVATGRLLADGHIGRLAVAAPWRGSGLGRRILDHLIELGWEAGHAELRLAAQRQAQLFYRKRGFVEYGEIFDDAGIPHIMMRLEKEQA